MKSTRQPSKPLKQEPKADKSQPQIILNSADEPTERQADQYQSISTFDERPQQQVSEDAIATPITDPEQQPKSPRLSKPRTQKPELRDQFQHIKFLDCNKPVGRVIFECWHC